MSAFSFTAGRKRQSSVPISWLCTIRTRDLSVTTPIPTPPARITTEKAWTDFWKHESISVVRWSQFKTKRRRVNAPPSFLYIKKAPPSGRKQKNHILPHLLSAYPPSGAVRRTAQDSHWLSAHADVKWPLTTSFLPSKPFCVVKGHFAAFLVSNILVTSAFCSLTTSHDAFSFPVSLFLPSLYPFKRDDLISWKDDYRLNRL